MTFTARLLRPAFLLALIAAALAGFGQVAANGFLPAPPAGCTGDYAQVVARLAENRRVEFGLQIGGRTLLPERRFVSLDRGATGWLRSSEIALPDGRAARVVARRIADGRFEWGLRVGGSDARLLPDDRYIPPLRSFTSWLHSRAIALPLLCCGGQQRLKLGFFAFFEPVSYSADGDPESSGYREHRGYEAALINAIETMEQTDLSFERIPIGVWSDIWLSPTKPEFDMVGGGITILESRTKDHSGRVAVAFTSGHIAFRQTLLVRAADADRIRTHADLTSDDRIGAVPGTTGEARLLQLAGLADEHGALAAGTRIETPNGVVVADGSAAFTITSSEQTANVAGRTRLVPPNADLPQVIYMGDDESAYIAAVLDGQIDGLARGELGNADAVQASAGALAVTAFDPAVEYGGFSLRVEDAQLLTCLDARINWLTNNRQIGYADWVANPNIFTKRATAWNAKY